MKTAVASDDDEPYDWADDAALSLSATLAQFELLRSVPPPSTVGTGTSITLTLE